MSQIPRDTRFDSTLTLLSEGYTFISRRCQRYQSDLFETRLMLQKAICMRGAEAAEVFYAPGRFTRRGALPKTALWLLQDSGSVAVLDPTVAAVELLNVLRPTVAVAHFVTFAALALHDHPSCREPIQAGDDTYLEAFVYEVRRFYPFFPVVAGRVLQAFDWQGYYFPPGTWVLLDLYGTNHDPRLWEQPDTFRPERFRGWPGSAFSLIPQGGGEYASNHRCPGEGSTIALIKRAVQLLTTAMDYSVPAQDLRISLARMPAIPNSRFVIGNVRPVR